jgi:hypothetical protein
VFNFNFAFYDFSETEGLEGKGVNSGPATFKPAAKGDVICFASVWDKAISNDVAVYVSGKGTVEIWTLGAALSGGGNIFLPTLNSKGEFPGQTGGPVNIPLLTVPTVAREKVIAATKADDWFVRATACWILGETGKPEDVRLLADMTKDTHWYVVRFALQAIGQLGGKASVEPLIQTAKAGPTKDQKPYRKEMVRTMLEAMTKVGSPDFLPVLEEMQTNGTDETLKKEITDAIAKIKG